MSPTNNRIILQFLTLFYEWRSFNHARLIMNMKCNFHLNKRRPVARIATHHHVIHFANSLIQVHSSESILAARPQCRCTTAEQIARLWSDDEQYKIAACPINAFLKIKGIGIAGGWPWLASERSPSLSETHSGAITRAQSNLLIKSHAACRR